MIILRTKNFSKDEKKKEIQLGLLGASSGAISGALLGSAKKDKLLRKAEELEKDYQERIQKHNKMVEKFNKMPRSVEEKINFENFSKNLKKDIEKDKLAIEKLVTRAKKAPIKGALIGIPVVLGVGYGGRYLKNKIKNKEK